MRPGDLQPITGGGGAGWFWDVVAPQNGTYTFKAELTALSDTDSDSLEQQSQITIVVDEQASSGGGGGGGGSGGGGGAAKATAGTVKLSPAKPKAGSTVVASVRVTKGGSPVRPVGVTCSASVGGAKAKGGPKAASGLAVLPVQDAEEREGHDAGRIDLVPRGRQLLHEAVRGPARLTERVETAASVSPAPASIFASARSSSAVGRD